MCTGYGHSHGQQQATPTEIAVFAEYQKQLLRTDLFGLKTCVTDNAEHKCRDYQSSVAKAKKKMSFVVIRSYLLLFVAIRGY